MDNHLLIKKLKRYSALTVPAMAMASMANAQVIYTDVNPDKELLGNPGNPPGELIDMDNNGSFEFVLAVWQSFTLDNGVKVNVDGVGLYSDNSAGIMGSTAFLGNKKFYYPSLLQPNETIDVNDHFRDYFGQYGTLVWMYQNGNGTFGQWDDVTDGYMGVRFKGDDGGTHYGWVRMDVFKNPPKIVLKDYAYQATADQAINAGEGMITGIPGVQNNDAFKIFSSGKEIFIQSSGDNGQPMNISVSDMTGKEIIHQTSTQSSITISAKSVADGMYIVHVTKNGRESTKKISLH